MSIQVKPEYRAALEYLKSDIQTKTGILVAYKIDNQNINGDAPTILLNLKGTTNITTSPSGVVLSQEILLVMEMSAVAANPANIADILEAEAKVTPIFPISSDYKTAVSKKYELTSTENYTMSYYSLWSLAGNEMQSDKYKRKWDLKMSMYYRR